MDVFFVLFGLVSVDLVQTLMANFELLNRCGVTVVAEGALHQLAGLAL
ncbi:hypothetical protein IAI53_07670 [Thauera sp. CAU 1555]|uniref:Uncharacterized protein n=1 Tax=Thauera sedimentorum TaxID=2767595 RepID=A0ABR9BBE8_9RHOO|nr:hypothetical protein [Thauera sedimentorum]MBC9071843.1 hypothetical protein [Thauera sedimentorum]MBD8502762.1 hypothetical protein [Thauera sedimentorum]